MTLSNKFRLLSRVPAFSRPAPVLLTLPVIVGAATTGTTLTVADGTWSNGPYTIERKWLRAGAEIEGATNASYTLTAEDIGALITVQERAYHAGGSSALTLAVAVGPVLASNPVFPETQTITWGAQTPKGWGAHPLLYLGTGTLSITSGNASGLWAISTASHVNGANRLITTGVYGSAAPAYSGSYVLTVTDGTYTSIVTVQVLGNEISAGYFIEVDTAARRVGGVSVRYGDVIAVRNGIGAHISGGKVSAYTQRLDGPGQPASMSDPGWVTIRPDVGATTNPRNIDLLGNNFFLKIDGCTFSRYNTTSQNASAYTVVRMRNATAGVWVWMNDCEVYSRLETGTTATATNIASGISILSGTDVFLTNNYVHDLYTGIKAPGRRHKIIGNLVANIWEDCLTGAPEDADVLFNFFYDKKYGSGVHGDFYQMVWNGATGAKTGSRVVGNLFVRGQGSGPTASDGQGIFWGGLGVGGSTNNDQIYGNLIICAKGNGIAIQNTVNSKIKWNTVVFGEYRDVPAGGGLTTQFIKLESASSGCDVSFNICMAFGTNGGTFANNLTADLSDYATIFANPIRDGNNDLATLLARWAVKPGGPADGATKHGAVTPYINVIDRVWSFPDGFAGSA